MSAELVGFPLSRRHPRRVVIESVGLGICRTYQVTAYDGDRLVGWIGRESKRDAVLHAFVMSGEGKVPILDCTGEDDGGESAA